MTVKKPLETIFKLNRQRESRPSFDITLITSNSILHSDNEYYTAFTPKQTHILKLAWMDSYDTQ